MAKVLFHATMSLDGFITGPRGAMDWVGPFVGTPNPAVDELMPRIGALLIGANTFRGGEAADAHPASRPEGAPYGGAWSGPMFVLTRDPAEPPVDGYTFVAGDLRDAVEVAKAAADGGYVVVLGATTARGCLEAGLLDEVLLHVAPVLLGDGVRMFDRAAGAPVRLEWMERSTAGDIENLWARVAY
jgi:dihydrofolate reductase